MYKYQKSTNNLRKILLTAIIIIVLLVMAIFIYNYFKNDTAKKTVHFVPKAIPSKPINHKPVNSNATINQGGATPKAYGASSSALPPPSQWTVSSTGNITLQQPSANSTITSGSTISGLAKVNHVQFMLTDNKVGLIAQGNLPVTNGKFSGNLHFIAHSSSGSIQVFYPNPNNAAEEDLININVNFKNY